MSASTPTLDAAALRRPVTVTRHGRPTVTGRLIAVGGRKGARCRVLLPSGAVISAHIADVTLTTTKETQ